MNMPVDREISPKSRFPERLPLALINQVQPTGGLQVGKITISNQRSGHSLEQF